MKKIRSEIQLVLALVLLAFSKVNIVFMEITHIIYNPDSLGALSLFDLSVGEQPSKIMGFSGLLYMAALVLFIISLFLKREKIKKLMCGIIGCSVVGEIVGFFFLKKKVDGYSYEHEGWIHLKPTMFAYVLIALALFLIVITCLHLKRGSTIKAEEKASEDTASTDTIERYMDSEPSSPQNISISQLNSNTSNLQIPNDNQPRIVKSKRILIGVAGFAVVLVFAGALVFLVKNRKPTDAAGYANSVMNHVEKTVSDATITYRVDFTLTKSMTKYDEKSNTLTLGYVSTQSSSDAWAAAAAQAIGNDDYNYMPGKMAFYYIGKSIDEVDKKYGGSVDGELPKINIILYSSDLEHLGISVDGASSTIGEFDFQYKESDVGY